MYLEQYRERKKNQQQHDNDKWLSKSYIARAHHLIPNMRLCATHISLKNKQARASAKWTGHKKANHFISSLSLSRYTQKCLNIWQMNISIAVFLFLSLSSYSSSSPSSSSFYCYRCCCFVRRLLHEISSLLLLQENYTWDNLNLIACFMWPSHDKTHQRTKKKNTKQENPILFCQIPIKSFR